MAASTFQTPSHEERLNSALESVYKQKERCYSFDVYKLIVLCKWKDAESKLKAEEAPLELYFIFLQFSRFVAELDAFKAIESQIDWTATDDELVKQVQEKSLKYLLENSQLSPALQTDISRIFSVFDDQPHTFASMIKTSSWYPNQFRALGAGSAIPLSTSETKDEGEKEVEVDPELAARLANANMASELASRLLKWRTLTDAAQKLEEGISITKEELAANKRPTINIYELLQLAFNTGGLFGISPTLPQLFEWMRDFRFSAHSYLDHKESAKLFLSWYSHKEFCLSTILHGFFYPDSPVGLLLRTKDKELKDLVTLIKTQDVIPSLAKKEFSLPTDRAEAVKILASLKIHHPDIHEAILKESKKTQAEIHTLYAQKVINMGQILETSVRAMNLNPTDLSNRYNHATFLITLKRTEEAFKELRIIWSAVVWSTADKTDRLTKFCSGMMLLKHKAKDAPQQESKESDEPTLKQLLQMLPDIDKEIISNQYCDNFILLLINTPMINSSIDEDTLKNCAKHVLKMMLNCQKIKQHALWEALVNSGSLLGNIFKKREGIFSASYFKDILKELSVCAKDQIVMNNETKKALEKNEGLQEAIWKQDPALYNQLEYVAAVKEFKKTDHLRTKKDLPQSAAARPTLGGDED